MAVLKQHLRVIYWATFIAVILVLPVPFLSAGEDALLGAVLIVIAYASLAFSSISAWLDQVGRWSHQFFYKSVLLGLLFLFSFLPGVALYKLAWDCQEWVFTHQEQVSVARALQERAERVQRYYSRVQVADQTPQAEWLFLQRRLQREDLDRYDKAVLSVRGQRFSARVVDRALEPVLWLSSWTLPSSSAVRTQRRIDWSREGSRWSWELAGSNRMRLKPASGPVLPAAFADAPQAGALWRSASTTEFDADYDLVTELRDLQAGDFLRRIALPAILLIGIAFWWIGTATRQMLGLEFDPGPPLDSVELATIPASTNRVVLLGGPEENKTTEIKKRNADIHRLDTEEAVEDSYLFLDSISQPAVALDHFEYRLDDPKASAAKLDIIRRLERLKKNVMLVSTIDPVFYWQDTQSKDAGGALDNQMDHPAIALRSFEVKRIKPSITPAKNVYSSLWLTCSPSEKIALHQLATEGWSNYKNADALQHLFHRGIICHQDKHPARFEFTDTGFRQFIRNCMSPQERNALSQTQGPSAWAGIRLVFLVVFLAAVAVLLLLSDQQMLGMVVSAASFLTPVYRLISTLRANSLFASLGSSSSTTA